MRGNPWDSGPPLACKPLQASANMSEGEGETGASSEGSDERESGAKLLHGAIDVPDPDPGIGLFKPRHDGNLANRSVPAGQRMMSGPVRDLSCPRSRLAVLAAWHAALKILSCGIDVKRSCHVFLGYVAAKTS